MRERAKRCVIFASQRRGSLELNGWTVLFEAQRSRARGWKEQDRGSDGSLDYPACTLCGRTIVDCSMDGDPQEVLESGQRHVGQTNLVMAVSCNEIEIDGVVVIESFHGGGSGIVGPSKPSR